MVTMVRLGALTFIITTVVSIEDTFHYGITEGSKYGPSDWGEVQCDTDTCPGWHDKWGSIGKFIPEVENNTCLDCRETDDKGVCKLHKQSPIHLRRNITDKRLCHDRHRMSFKRGNCGYQNLTFTIARHALRANQALVRPKDTICSTEATIDFSQGFPDDWNLKFTDIKVPSEHVQDGKQYDAEVILSHVYSKNKTDKFVGNVVIFLEAGNNTDYYDFLDLYIRGWLKAEKGVRDNCAVRQLHEQYIGLRSTQGDSTEQQEKEREAARTLKKRRFRRPFHAYDWLKKVDTEYYFRYEGSQTIPPCFDQAVHWRVMKDPIRVAPEQIQQLEDLIARRVDPELCSPDTAGKSRNAPGNKVDVNRPIQSLTRLHKAVFCECVNWPSRLLKDQEWCNITMEERGVVPYFKTLLN